MTDTLIAPATISSIDTSNCCEDCPDANVNPPDKSECPYFDASGDVPVCTRDGGMDELIRNFIGPTTMVATEVYVQTHAKA